jgi:predicted Zn-dependent protease
MCLLSRALVLLGLVFLVSCAASPTGRRQLRFFPPAEVQTMGIAAFDKLKKETPQSNDPHLNRYVRCIANAITAEIQGSGNWEVVVFQDVAANAFALPGGKIGVYTGMLKIAANQDQLATVIGHEVAHVISQHPNERVSTQYATQTGLQKIGEWFGAGQAANPQLMGLLGIGAQVGLTLPFGRKQETEADIVGLNLMARAGFDPRQSVPLWQNMATQGGPTPPEILSTHPANQTRITGLSEYVRQVLPLYEAAQAQGKRPRCL